LHLQFNGRFREKVLRRFVIEWQLWVGIANARSYTEGLKWAQASDLSFAALCTNGSTDKVPFPIWIIVEVATYFSSTLCANTGSQFAHIVGNIQALPIR
jgi:hypothetical protein